MAPRPDGKRPPAPSGMIHRLGAPGCLAMSEPGPAVAAFGCPGRRPLVRAPRGNAARVDRSVAVSAVFPAGCRRGPERGSRTPTRAARRNRPFSSSPRRCSNPAGGGRVRDGVDPNDADPDDLPRLVEAVERVEAAVAAVLRYDRSAEAQRRRPPRWSTECTASPSVASDIPSAGTTSPNDHVRRAFRRAAARAVDAGGPVASSHRCHRCHPAERRSSPPGTARTLLRVPRIPAKGAGCGASRGRGPEARGAGRGGR